MHLSLKQLDTIFFYLIFETCWMKTNIWISSIWIGSKTADTRILSFGIVLILHYASRQRLCQSVFVFILAPSATTSMPRVQPRL